ncbi:OmpA family protein [Hydrogenophaga pseudoflava]|uniref:OmpA family protein n=1 Tax=Hydrogenophaga pseudoflava TaxID=47421 RepID=UPI0027E53177|nr:OmpA family protein [Hydrogenophaga pseudoflava]MDQ7744360.1 OmpA family protein [Hydrogenophaga pseudoflava]
MRLTTFSSTFPRALRSPRTPAVLLLASALAAAGCANMSERESATAKGAGAGAVAGAVLGGVTGGNAGRGAIIGGAVGAVAGNLWSKRMQDKQAALAQAAAGSGVAVERTNDNQLLVSVPTDVSFDSGSAVIRPQMRPVLDGVGRSIDPAMRVTVVGHTDSTGGDMVNDRLSQARAQAVGDYLVARGVSSSQLRVIGHGAREPVASNDTVSGRAANRRVEIFLSEPPA